MGIEGFLKRIRDAGYGTRKDLGRSGTEEHTLAIIDGPSLAYHIYNKLSDGEAADSAIAPKVTYEAVAAAVVGCLDRLQTYGFHIEAIFFDGALPASKKDTRTKRLTNYAQKLAAFQRIHDEGTRNARDQSNGTYWKTVRIYKARKERPPPAFLVAVATEALVHSSYGDITFVVPDEADRFCVAAARQASVHANLDVAIFTNDSDLIVFDSGAKTRVVLFNDLNETAPGNTESSMLSGIEFRPWEILQKHRLTSLLEIAYLLKLDRGTSFAEAVRSAPKGNVRGRHGLKEFAQEYQIVHQQADYQILRGAESQRALGNGLDARLSELVQQVKTGQGSLPFGMVDMYLPFLLEDSSRASAWRIGTGWRAAAYKLLLTAYNCSCMGVREYKRHASRVIGTEVALFDSSDLDNNLSLANQWVDSSLVKEMPLADIERWRLMVMELTAQDIENQGYTFNATQEDVATVLTGRSTSSWNIVHLSAQYQAMYYSMRILVQVKRYIDGLERASSPTYASQFPRLGLDLERSLGSFFGQYGIADFFEPVFNPTKALPKADWDDVLERYRPFYHRPPVAENEEMLEVGPVETRLSEHPLSDESSEGEEAGGSLASNPFAALADR